MWHPAIRLEELAPGLAVRVVLDERPVMLVLDGGDVLAISDVCPHNGASLSEGIVRDGCVTCPAHLWRFSLRDGRKQGDGRALVATYPTRVHEDSIDVDLPERAPQRSLREVLLAHARGEEVS